jgi:hypothetical protein
MTNKDLISQYVDTGIRLPEYQISKLNSSDRKTYLRKRLISAKAAGSSLTEYEFNLLPYEGKLEYVLIKAKTHGVSDEIFRLLPDDVKIKYAVAKASSTSQISDYQFNLLPDEGKKLYLKAIGKQ